jgi:cystathionine gamma-synthase
VFSRFGITVVYSDTSRLEEIERSIDKSTKAIFIETPTNPTMKIADLRGISALAKTKGLCLIVDNTFMTPYFQRPIELGADIVLHSGTKFLGGHNDTLCGVAVCADMDKHERIRFIQNTTGGVLSAFDSWLIIRGLKTLSLRMERSQNNADTIARWMIKRKEIFDVNYPGLPNFPGREIHMRQSSGSGSIISFRLRDGAIANSLINRCKVIRFAESLGGVESLVTRPSTQTHSFMPVSLRESLGITDAFLRLSVGIEDVSDLIIDLEQAMES